MGFYQDEFAGRIATKVMQTALAVRDAWLTVADILVFITIYFVTMVAVVGSFDAWLLVPFLGWLTCTPPHSSSSCRGWARSPPRRPTPVR